MWCDDGDVVISAALDPEVRFKAHRRRLQELDGDFWNLFRDPPMIPPTLAIPKIPPRPGNHDLPNCRDRRDLHNLTEDLSIHAAATVVLDGVDHHDIRVLDWVYNGHM